MNTAQNLNWSKHIMIPEDGIKKRLKKQWPSDGSRQRNMKKSRERAMIEITGKLTSIIQMQTEIIDKAINLLLMHVNTDDVALGNILTQHEYVKAMQIEVEADPLNDVGLPFN